MTVVLGFLLKIITALVAFVVIRLSLQQLDKYLKFDFRSWFRKAPDQVKGNYLGCRFIGICVLFGFILL